MDNIHQPLRRYRWWHAAAVGGLASNLRVANLPQETPGRRAALASEAVSWGLFASFSGLYFGLRSPTLGAMDTVLGLAATVHGVTVTAKLDHTAGWLLVPRLAWLAYASYVSVATAVRSPDDLLRRTETAVSRLSVAGTWSADRATRGSSPLHHIRTGSTLVPVVPNSNGGGDVREPGGNSPLSHAATSAEAARRARASMLNGGTIHVPDADGAVLQLESVPAPVGPGRLFSVLRLPPVP